jgi:hypothetical protein
MRGDTVATPGYMVAIAWIAVALAVAVIAWIVIYGFRIDRRFHEREAANLRAIRAEQKNRSPEKGDHQSP